MYVCGTGGKGRARPSTPPTTTTTTNVHTHICPYVCTLYTNSYPPVSQEERATLSAGMGCGEHSDYGCLTLLNMDDSREALQVGRGDICMCRSIFVA